MKELLNLSFILEPTASKQNFYYSFYVPECVNALHVVYSYTPKKLTDEKATDAIIEAGFARYILAEDAPALSDMKRTCRPLVNLVTLSFDSPAGYVGAAHRQASEQEHYLSREKADPGFCPECFAPGLWRVCVSAHAVVTETCSVKLLVEGAEA